METNYSRNIYLGFFSLLFGFFLWLYVLSSAQTKGTTIYKVRYNLPPNVSIVSQPINEIKFKVKGPRVFIRNLTLKENTHYINLNNFLKKGSTNIKLEVNELGFKFPFGVEVEDVEPSVINIELEGSMVKQIPINLVTIGRVPIDHKMIYSELKPNVLSISGPKSVVQKINQIDSDPINLSDLRGSGEFVVNYAPFDQRIELSEENFTYSYFVKPTRSNMILKNIPIRFLSSHIVKSSDRRKVNLMVLADDGDKINYTKEDLEVIAQIPLQASERMKIPLKANLPKGMHVLEIIPKEIEVELDLGVK